MLYVRTFRFVRYLVVKGDEGKLRLWSTGMKQE